MAWGGDWLLTQPPKPCSAGPGVVMLRGCSPQRGWWVRLRGDGERLGWKTMGGNALVPWCRQGWGEMESEGRWTPGSWWF